MSRNPPKSVVDAVKLLEAKGIPARYLGLNGRGHARIRIGEAGEITVAASTRSKRAFMNMLAQARRIMRQGQEDE